MNLDLKQLTPTFSETTKDRTGILLVNLGTPSHPTPWYIWKFLRQFLGDARVIQLPFWGRWLIQYGILPFRSFRVTRAYQSIWMEEGSPLRVYTQALAEKLSMKLSLLTGETLPVFSAMTYGNPSIKTAIECLQAQHITRCIILPLFPFYSETTTAGVFDSIARAFRQARFIPKVFFINEYGLEAGYLRAMAHAITEFWRLNGRGERLLFSFHGVPKYRATNGDPYSIRTQTAGTALAKMLNIPENFYEISYQSKFGRTPWLHPATDEILVQWARSGVKCVDCVAPSFAVDCLETLEELNQTSRKKFTDAGGESFRYIQAQNAEEGHVDALIGIIERLV